MKKYKFKHIKNDIYHVIIEAENKEKARERYEVLYRIKPDI